MNLTIWDHENRELSQSSVTLRVLNPFQEQELLANLFGVFYGHKFLPMCSMVGCATNATQCVGHGGKEMFNKMSVGDYTQAYFKSLYTLDNTYLSINCNKFLIPCCFINSLKSEKPKPSSHWTLFPLRMPSLPSLPKLSLEKYSMIKKLISLIPELPPMSIYVMSNICKGITGGVALMACNQNQHQDD
ncbi:unnamed protein product [Oppiella nova]|uniref:Uncharacterized protein n=1 Tax=Oppiella nova TaxID=334625 RepID=A0A7R9QTH8_9ACAR|nr:unnamed protein product [Oppiella nova]CAG2173779.1 unnamed protein product [Oppiella nova]